MFLAVHGFCPREAPLHEASFRKREKEKERENKSYREQPRHLERDFAHVYKVVASLKRLMWWLLFIYGFRPFG